MPDASLSKPRILVVEDNYLVADTICDLVRDCGCEVAGAVGHVHDGVELLSAAQVDGAVVDINLHGSPSYALCDELQRRNVPFFFLTGHSARSSLPHQFQTARLLTKPLDVGQFKSALADIKVSLPEKRARRSLGNGLLDSLSDGDLRLLESKLERVALHDGAQIETAGQPLSHVHFLTGGLVSTVARGDHGHGIELALVSTEGATGIAALLESSGTSFADSIVQVGGTAWRIRADELAPLLQLRGSLQADLLRYVHAIMAEVAATTLATGHAKIEQRVARWLLIAADRCGTHKLAVTHDQLSKALAVRRSGITVALHMLESRRLVRSRRKLVEILDREGLLREIDGLFVPPIRSAAPVGLRDREDQAAG